MSSISSVNRKRVAKKVIDQVMSGKKANVSQAMRDVGYSNSTADVKNSEVARSKEFQEETQSFVNQLEDLMQDSIGMMKEKKKKGSYRDHETTVEQFAKLKQLLTGGNTSNDKMSISWDD
jgi:hypothetical protein